jgi:hypothetical protein
VSAEDISPTPEVQALRRTLADRFTPVLEQMLADGTIHDEASAAELARFLFGNGAVVIFAAGGHPDDVETYERARVWAESAVDDVIQRADAEEVDEAEVESKLAGGLIPAVVLLREEIELGHAAAPPVINGAIAISGRPDSGVVVLSIMRENADSGEPAPLGFAVMQPASAANMFPAVAEAIKACGYSITAEHIKACASEEQPS